MSVSFEKYLCNRERLRCICGSTRQGVVFRRSDRYRLPFRYSLCLKCGHVRTVDPINRNLIGDFYGSSNYRTLYHKTEKATEYFARVGSRPAASQKLFMYCQSNIQSTGLVIEWGCSGGWNLIAFRDAGWRVIGYDLDTRFVAEGRKLYGLDLHVAKSGLPSASITEAPNLIILNHVLEHVFDPVAFLRDLRKCCIASTVVVVGVPLLETMKIWHWKNFFHIAHIHYFSARTLRYCALTAGFEIIDSRSSPGYFTLKIGSPKVTELGKRSVFASIWYLSRGFLEPVGRLRKTVYKVICAVGLKERYDAFVQSRRKL